MRKIIFILLLLVPVIADGQVITTFAGTGSAVFSGDGSAASVAGISNPGCIVFDKFSNSYVASGMDNRIRKISSTGIISTFAGTGSGTFGGDGGAATLAKLYLPQAVRLDTFGHIYILRMQAIIG